MPRLITLSRAARLVGVKRGALQKKIREGELRTFEGEILLTDLLQSYPQTEVEDTSMLERVEQIMEQAVNKIVRPADDAPDSGALATRVMALSQELATARHEARRLAGVINGLQAQFDLLDSGDSLPDDAFSTLRQWLATALATEAADELETDEIFARETFLRVMEAQIRILPSGHEFLIEGSDSILEAGLRNGLALAYGCSNGNCGKCKAKLVSGQIKKIHQHDYVLTEAEKALGYFLTCSSTAVTDVVMEAEEAAGSRDIPLQNIDVRIRKIERPDDRVVVLETRTPRTNRLRFLAGQYLTLKIDDLPTCDCSITSCPCDGMNLQFQIPVTAGDPLSEHLATNARAHDIISISGPRGDFILNEESSRSLVFIAGNAGIGPIKSLIEHAMALDIAEDIHLAWITTDGNSHYLGNLCRSWDDALDNFHYTALQANGEQSAQSLLPQITGKLGSLDQYDCYVCMPSPLLEPVKNFLTASGAPENQVRVESLR
ncbi:MAG: 2Fe-2S iron-sulfur cluster binding domain-containing protein [Gammaproteobacteria bacterium]|nr:MAG: 2Fe-2S iron-sulfur cluster binding domain-containing protein [Gammaproteobacteria bacterium]